MAKAQQQGVPEVIDFVKDCREYAEHSFDAWYDTVVEVDGTFVNGREGSMFGICSDCKLYVECCWYTSKYVAVK